MSFFNQYTEEVKGTLDQLPWSQVEKTVDILFSVWLRGGRVFIMGNGGSAATSSHMACDLGKNTAAPGHPRLRVMSLNDNMALFSAHSNDNGYDQVFAEQLSTFVQTGDAVIAISASGNSPNVLNAIQLGRNRGATTIGLSGYAGGTLAQLVDLPIVIPNHNIEQIEDVDLIVSHMMTAALRGAMYKHLPAAQIVNNHAANGIDTFLAPHSLQSAAD